MEMRTQTLSPLAGRFFSAHRAAPASASSSALIVLPISASLCYAFFAVPRKPLAALTASSLTAKGMPCTR
jgi:hypothetical protein